MPSTSDPADLQNSSFGPGSRYPQDLKPGFEPAERDRGAEDDGHHRRPPSESDVPRAPLAERIRERESE